MEVLSAGTLIANDIRDNIDVIPTSPRKSGRVTKWLSILGPIMYIMLWTGLPYLVYNYTLTKDNIYIPYLIGYGSIILINILKLIESLISSITYVYKCIFKDRTTLIREDGTFYSVYDTDIHLFKESGDTKFILDDVSSKHKYPDISVLSGPEYAVVSTVIPDLMIIIPAYLIN